MIRIPHWRKCHRQHHKYKQDQRHIAFYKKCTNHADETATDPDFAAKAMGGIPVVFVFQRPFHANANGAVLTDLWKKISTDEEKQAKAEEKHHHKHRVGIDPYLHKMLHTAADQRGHRHHPEHQCQHARMLFCVGSVAQHKKHQQPMGHQKIKAQRIQLPQQHTVQQGWQHNHQRRQQQLFLIRHHRQFHGWSLLSASSATA